LKHLDKRRMFDPCRTLKIFFAEVLHCFVSHLPTLSKSSTYASRSNVLQFRHRPPVKRMLRNNQEIPVRILPGFIADTGAVQDNFRIRKQTMHFFLDLMEKMEDMRRIVLPLLNRFHNFSSQAELQTFCIYYRWMRPVYQDRRDTCPSALPAV
jgi:hypothetical protein